MQCKVSNLLGGKCGKSGGNPSSCGDGTEYVIKNEQEKPVGEICFLGDLKGLGFFEKAFAVLFFLGVLMLLFPFTFPEYSVAIGFPTFLD